MTLSKRIFELLQIITNNIPEREYFIELGFLSTVIGEPFYLFGRPGSGRTLITSRITSAFKNPKILTIDKSIDDVKIDPSTFDLAIFYNFDPLDEKSKTNLQKALLNRDKKTVIISGCQRPEVALNRAEVSDLITLSLMLPETISSGALCTLLKSQEASTNVYVPLGVAISQEERNQWLGEVKKITLSEGTMNVIGKVAENCEKNNIYVPIRKWLALANMVKAIAFFNGRTETKLTDTFFLGTSIWGRSVSNSAISESYKDIVKQFLLKDNPTALEAPYDADGLLTRVKYLLHRSNHLYETKDFNGEKCILYRISVANENIPLYVPERYIESDEDFNPYNELRQPEKRVICNYHGTHSCTISIDSSIKSIGLRNSIARSQTPTLGKFEEISTQPTYILKENSPEVIERKKAMHESLQKEIQATMARETKNLFALRDTYKHIKESKDDLFCYKPLFNSIQEETKALFDNTTVIIKKIKTASELLSQFSALRKQQN